MNPLYQYANAIFTNPELLHNQSVFIAQHLYENSGHPNIKPGDLMIVYFEEVVVEEEVVSALGIFKSEDKDTFLKLTKEGKSIDMILDKGINLGKLDKACIIFNSQDENGFKLCIKDHSNSQEANYWKHDFLNVLERNDDYHSTKKLY